MQDELQVHYFERKPGNRTYSLERVFADVRDHLPKEVKARVLKCPYESKGLWNRFLGMLWARRNGGPINHVTGDVHYLTLLLPKSQTILTVADCVSLVRSRGLRRWFLWMFWYKLPTASVSCVTTISSFTREQLLREVKCKPDKVHPIYCPVSPAFRPTAKKFNAEQPVLLQVGTGWNKNLVLVAKALKGLRCRLEVIGPLSDLQRQVLTDCDVEYNQQNDVSDNELVSLYEKCDLVIFASTYEGFGLPIIEAQAMGRPVITSNTCSMPEVAGDGACLVDPTDADSIRSAIVRIIQDEDYRNRLIADGLQNVLRYDPARIAREYAELYKQLAAPRRGES